RRHPEPEERVVTMWRADDMARRRIARARARGPENGPSARGAGLGIRRGLGHTRGMTSASRALFAFSILSLLASCDASHVVDRRCSSTLDCDSGESCVDGVCLERPDGGVTGETDGGGTDAGAM